MTGDSARVETRLSVYTQEYLGLLEQVEDQFCVIFQVQPLDDRETPVTTGVYVRSGLLGFVGNVSHWPLLLVYVSCVVGVGTTPPSLLF